jgi:Xaa-Pro aminopeptidase
LEFETLSRLPIDPGLIDESLLTESEKRWLADYHSNILAEYQGCFDEETSTWLQQIVDTYRATVTSSGTPLPNVLC